MNEPRAKSPLRHPLAAQHRAHTRALVLRNAWRGAAFCGIVIVLALLVGVAFAPGVAGAWTRLALVLAAVAIGVLGAARRFGRARLAFDTWLERAELRFPQIRSWLRNALDLERGPAPHTSPELASALADETARRLEQVPLASLRPPVEARRPALVLVAALLVVTAIGVIFPARTARSWRTLWDPAAAAPPVRLEVEPGSVTVTPGAALSVRARVYGTERAPRLLRDQERAPSAVAEGIGQGGARVWRFDLTQLTRPEEYRVRVASAESPRYRISLSGDPAPVSFEVEYHAPAYARLPVQRGAAARGDLIALRGTRARLTVTFDRDLDDVDAALPGGRATTWKALTPRRWRGEVPIEREGAWTLHARAGAGATPAGEGRFTYKITPLDDAPPVLAVSLPTGDVDLPVGQRVAVDVMGQDDLGLAELKLQYRKEADGPWRDVPLGRFASYPREARVATQWDVSGLALLPGQSASFRFELSDHNVVSGPGRAVSPVFELRFPGLADLYDKIDDKQGTAQRALEKVADQARELQKSLDKLTRQVPRPGSESQSFERSEEMKSALERQQEIARTVDESARALKESVEQAAERQAFDEQLTRKLQEMNELMQQIQSRELKEAMKKMQEALEKMDRRELDQDLAKMREENQELLKNLERTVELLKQLREEEKLQSLAQRAQELKAQQDALNQEHQRQEDQRAGNQDKQNKELSEQQRRAAQESEQLAKEARELGQQTENKRDDPELEKAADELSQEAAPSQRDAAESSAQQQPQKAGKSGKQASESLQRAAQRLQTLAQQSQQEQDQVDLAAVRRAAQDLVSLQRATEETMSSNASPRDKADRQTDLSEGAARVADSLFQLSQETPFISPKLGEALGRAINNLQTSGRELGAGNRARGEQTARNGSESLNEAVIELRAAESQMCQNPGNNGGQGRKPNPRKLGEVGQQQSQLNQRSRSLAERLTQQVRLSSGDRDELRRLADEQARIREQVEEIKRDEERKRELLGKLDQTQREMKEVEEVLRSGTGDGTLEEKQQRILSRLLDAQRSINRRDFDPERESRPGEDVARSGPAALPPELLRENDRLRLDLLKAEADRYPAQYRAFVEAYLRSLNGSRR